MYTLYIKDIYYIYIMSMYYIPQFFNICVNILHTAYRYNTLTSIMEREPLVENQPPLYLVHRLDRVTSGLVVMAKSKEIAANVAQAIREKTTQKTYVRNLFCQFLPI